MSFVLYRGPNFSGRSDALRHFAWDSTTGPGNGQYLTALINNNLSGLARLVRGETHLHGIRSRRRNQIANGATDALLASLPTDQNLASLSGGETVRLLIACAVALRPKRLAIDGLLEQIDRQARPGLLKNVLAPLAAEIEIHLSDNDPDSLAGLFDKTIEFHRPPNAPNINGRLPTVAQGLSKERVDVPVLRLRDISFRYPRSSRAVLTQANYTFEPGRPYLLKAPNGAGKSTLAKLLAGVLTPQRGDLIVGGKPFAPSHDSSNLFFYAFQNPLDQIFGSSTKGYLTALSRVAAKRNTLLQGSLGITIDRAIDECGLSLFADTEPFDLPFVRC